MTGKGMGRSFMPRIQLPRAVPTRAAPRLDASPPDEDGKLGVDNGSPRPSDLSPPPFFWSRPPLSTCSSSPPRLDAGEASLPSKRRTPVMDMDPSFCAG
ncbi:hypothetical protein ACQJBY_011713 [Aegilops geniculata]